MVLIFPEHFQILFQLLCLYFPFMLRKSKHFVPRMLNRSGFMNTDMPCPGSDNSLIRS